MQCPNCGAYMMVYENKWPVAVHILGTVLTAGVWLLIITPFWIIRMIRTAFGSDFGRRVKCENCGYRTVVAGGSGSGAGKFVIIGIAAFIFLIVLGSL